MMRLNSSCVNQSVITRRSIQHRVTPMVQKRAVDEYRRALLAPLYAAHKGEKQDCPEVVQLMKHVAHGLNKVAETTMALSFAARRLPDATPESVCNVFDVGRAIMLSTFPGDEPLSFEQLHELETQIQSAIDPHQVAYLLGDHSTQRKRALLENFRRMRATIDRIIAWLERDLFGGQH